jgi:hypothetical protein
MSDLVWGAGLRPLLPRTFKDLDATAGPGLNFLMVLKLLAVGRGETPLHG